MKNHKKHLLAGSVVVILSACNSLESNLSSTSPLGVSVNPNPAPLPTIGPLPLPLPLPLPTGPGPTQKTDLDAFSIPAPGVPVPETTPDPLCIDGKEYKFVLGDDFSQQTQAQFSRYTTQWEINQYEYNGAHTNWLWSDQYSGIGRRNDFGFGDTYMVHIDDSNRYNSYPAPWVNDISPRPGAQIIGSPPNSYLDIRAVYVPAAHQGEASLNGAHWLSGGLQGSKFTFGYTESTVIMPDNDGSWPSDWMLQVPGGGGWDGTGTSPTNYFEIDTFEKFGNTLGIDGIQMTSNSGRPDALVARPQTPGSTTSWHTYGQLWVGPQNGKPSYIVFYVDRKPTSTFLTPAGIGDVNFMTNLQMGVPGSFVGTPDPSRVADLKLKNYFTWQTAGQPCGAVSSANPIPMPPPPPPPQPAPAVAANIVPQLQPFNGPNLNNTFRLNLPQMPVNGSLLVAGGISASTSCPTGFVTTGFADTILCTAIVGQNGVVAAQFYNAGGAGMDRSFILNINNVKSYTVGTNIGTSWHGEANPQITKSQSVSAANGLVLAIGYALTDSPRYTTSANYTSNIAFNTLFATPASSSYGRTLTVLEGKDDPFTAPGSTPSFSGSYTWTGTPSGSSNNLLPEIFTVVVQ